VRRRRDISVAIVGPWHLHLNDAYGETHAREALGAEHVKRRIDRARDQRGKRTGRRRPAEKGRGEAVPARGPSAPLIADFLEKDVSRAKSGGQRLEPFGEIPEASRQLQICDGFVAGVPSSALEGRESVSCDFHMLQSIIEESMRLVCRPRHIPPPEIDIYRAYGL
jgi:hypothetical protein